MLRQRGAWMRRTLSSVLALVSIAAAALAAPQEQPPGLRLIAVATEAEAADILARLRGGEQFDELARNHSLDSSAGEGGYLGRILVGNLRTEFQDALAGLSPGQISPIARVGREYVLLRLLREEETRWIEQNDAGRAAYRQGRYGEAEQFFAAAAQDAEEYGLGGSYLSDSLDNLAELHQAQGKYAEAESFYSRSLAIQEEALGPDHPNVALTL